MKLFAKCLAFIIVLACAGPFLMKGPDGHPLMGPNDISGFSIKSISQSLSISYNKTKQLLTSIQDKAGKTTNATTASNNIANKTSKIAYRWVDQHGTVHFSSQPNLNGSSKKIKLQSVPTSKTTIKH